jgi:hypothetical protein
MVSKINLSEPLYESYDESVLRPMRSKFAFVLNLIFVALKLKTEVRKLTNHPMNRYCGEILIDLQSVNHVGLEIGYAKEIFEFCDDFKLTRNKKLKIEVEYIRKLTQEILDGNYDYNRDYLHE